MGGGKRFRVVADVDGFNLHYGLREKTGRQFLWLDTAKLTVSLLGGNQDLVATKSFTARVSGNAGKQRRQATLLEAIEPVGIFYGQYLGHSVRCRASGGSWLRNEEKITDIDIATELLADAFEDRFDTAYVISGDSDLVPPIRKIRRLFPEKWIVAAFPPKRISKELRTAANRDFVIGVNKLRACGMPDPVRMANGHLLAKPARWS